MPNTLGLTEVTVVQLIDSTHAVNTGGTWDKVRVARVTNHASNVAGETGGDTEKMAIFECKAKGQPWQRRGTTLGHKIHKQAAGTTAGAPLDAEVYFPNWDYSTFE